MYICVTTLEHHLIIFTKIEHQLALSLVKESYMAQNSLELNLPSRASPPFYAKQRTRSPEGKNGHYGWLRPAPSWSSLWSISKIPCPSRLRDTFSEQPRRRTGPLKTVTFHIRAYVYLLISWGSSSLIWLLPLLASLKVICSCKVPVSFLFWTSPSLTLSPYSRPLLCLGIFQRDINVPKHIYKNVYSSAAHRISQWDSTQYSLKVDFGKCNQGFPDNEAGKESIYLPVTRRPQFNSWVRKIPWRRYRLPISVFLGFPGGSDGKESNCNAGDLGSTPGLERSPGEEKGYPTHPGILAWIIPWTGTWQSIVHGGLKESDTREQVSLSFSYTYETHWAITTYNNMKEYHQFFEN